MTAIHWVKAMAYVRLPRIVFLSMTCDSLFAQSTDATTLTQCIDLPSKWSHVAINPRPCGLRAHACESWIIRWLNRYINSICDVQHVISHYWPVFRNDPSEKVLIFPRLVYGLIARFYVSLDHEHAEVLSAHVNALG